MPGPQYPSYNTASWSFAIADRDLATVAFLTPFPDVVRYTRRENGYCEMVIEIRDRDDLNALESAVYSRVLRAWRNGVNKFNGEFVELRETADSWELVAKDPYYNLSWREVRTDVTYTAADAGQIAWNLIALQNGYELTHLRQGALDASANVTNTYKQGERIQEKIDYLAKSKEFLFTIDAVEGVASVWAEIVVQFPGGTLQPEAKFEFGAGTLANCDDYLRESLTLVNRANVVGKDNIVVSAESGSSPALHGLWEASRGHVLTDDTAVLTDIAASQITDAPQYSIVMSAGPEAPQLFTDFDVGDTVPVLIRRVGRTIEGNKRVREATVLLDPDSGAEELETLEVYE